MRCTGSRPASATRGRRSPHRIPTLLVLATLPPHVDQNREHVGRFQEAIPRRRGAVASERGHGIVDDVGPLLGDEIAVWLAANLDEP